MSNTQVDLDVLQSQVSLTDGELSKLSGISYDRRKREFLGVRNVVQHFFGANERITYHENGKPMLKESGYRISISHSGDLEAILVHETEEVGVDLQVYTSKIMKINKRFMSEAELAESAEDVWKTLVYWCAKEALFKYYAKGNVDFRTELYVHPFQMDDAGEIRGDIKKTDGESNVSMRYEKIEEDYMLVYTTNG